MQFVTYSWDERRSHRVNPQTVGEQVAAIARRDGSCVPARLVEEAEPETSPLHPLFTWNDEMAAGKWREHEARNVINALVVTIVKDGRESIAPAFISVGHSPRSSAIPVGYQPISIVVADDAMRQEALSEALSRLRSLQARYASIKELAPVWDAVASLKAA